MIVTVQLFDTREKWLQAVSFFHKSFTLDVWRSFEYPSMRCAINLWNQFAFWPRSSENETIFLKFDNYRSSRLEVFCKKGVLRNISKFTGDHLCQSLVFNKVAGLRPETLLNKRLCHRCFSVNLAKFLKTPFLTELFRWLFLQYFWRG